MAPASVKKSKKQGCRRCTDLQQKMAELGKRFHFPGEGEFHIQKNPQNPTTTTKKPKKTKNQTNKNPQTFRAVTKFCWFMERVSVRICCGGTAVPAVAPKAGMCCTHVERELQSSTLTYHRQLPAQFFHLLVISNFFLYKGTAPLAMHTPYR